MLLLSRKASDKELGAIKKTMEQEIAYWTTLWNFAKFEEWPSYLQGLYTLYTYSLWLEEQIAIMKEMASDPTIQSSERENSSPDSVNVEVNTEQLDAKGRVDEGIRVPEPILPANEPTDAVGGGKDILQSIDLNVLAN